MYRIVFCRRTIIDAAAANTFWYDVFFLQLIMQETGMFAPSKYLFISCSILSSLLLAMAAIITHFSVSQRVHTQFKNSDLKPSARLCKMVHTFNVLRCLALFLAALHLFVLGIVPLGERQYALSPLWHYFATAMHIYAAAWFMILFTMHMILGTLFAVV